MPSALVLLSMPGCCTGGVTWPYPARTQWIEEVARFRDSEKRLSSEVTEDFQKLPHCYVIRDKAIFHVVYHT